MRQGVLTVKAVVMGAPGLALGNALTPVQAVVVYAKDRVKVCVIIPGSKLWTRKNLSIVETFLEKALLQ